MCQTAGQRLAYLAGEKRRDRPQKQEAAITFALLVDRASKPREEWWVRLRLIQDEQLARQHEIVPLRVE
jgi:hypothetical protein